MKISDDDLGTHFQSPFQKSITKVFRLVPEEIKGAMDDKEQPQNEIPPPNSPIDIKEHSITQTIDSFNGEPPKTIPPYPDVGDIPLQSPLKIDNTPSPGKFSFNPREVVTSKANHRPNRFRQFDPRLKRKNNVRPRNHGVRNRKPVSVHRSKTKFPRPRPNVIHSRPDPTHLKHKPTVKPTPPPPEKGMITRFFEFFAGSSSDPEPKISPSKPPIKLNTQNRVPAKTTGNHKREKISWPRTDTIKEKDDEVIATSDYLTVAAVAALGTISSVAMFVLNNPVVGRNSNSDSGKSTVEAVADIVSDGIEEYQNHISKKKNESLNDNKKEASIGEFEQVEDVFEKHNVNMKNHLALFATKVYNRLKSYPSDAGLSKLLIEGYKAYLLSKTKFPESEKNWRNFAKLVKELLIEMFSKDRTGNINSSNSDRESNATHVKEHSSASETLVSWEKIIHDNPPLTELDSVKDYEALKDSLEKERSVGSIPLTPSISSTYTSNILTSSVKKSSPTFEIDRNNSNVEIDKIVPSKNSHRVIVHNNSIPKLSELEEGYDLKQSNEKEVNTEVKLKDGLINSLKVPEKLNTVAPGSPLGGYYMNNEWYTS